VRWAKPIIEAVVLGLLAESLHIARQLRARLAVALPKVGDLLLRQIACR
jgi:hypothetical protein